MTEIDKRKAEDIIRLIESYKERVHNRSLKSMTFTPMETLVILDALRFYVSSAPVEREEEGDENNDC